MRNPRYKPNKKNGGQPPKCDDKRKLWIPIGCKKCIECIKQKARDWRVRLLEEIQQHEHKAFITLTFSNEAFTKIAAKHKETGYELDNAVAKYAIRHWLENIRAKQKKSVKHWLTTEIGGNRYQKIHMHGIIFGTKKEVELAIEKWKYGFTWQGKYVTAKTINYIIKYCTKADERHPGYIPITLCSPGIGSGYEKSYNATKNTFRGGDTNELYRTQSGIKTALPMYYRNKLYSEDEREKLWVQKLDKQERWVLGHKVSTVNGLKDYYDSLKTARSKNERLGYKAPDWDREQYDKQQRILHHGGEREDPNHMERLTPEELDGTRESEINLEFEKLNKWLGTMDR